MLLQLDSPYQSDQYVVGQYLRSVMKYVGVSKQRVSDQSPLPISRYKDIFDAKIGRRPIHNVF